PANSHAFGALNAMPLDLPPSPPSAELATAVTWFGRTVQPRHRSPLAALDPPAMTFQIASPRPGRVMLRSSVQFTTETVPVKKIAPAPFGMTSSRPSHAQD